MKFGMVEITVRKNRWWKRNKDGVLYGTLIAPIALGFLLVDIFAKHPLFALGYLIGVGAWYVLFAFAQGRKKPRKAIRGRKSAHERNFRIYDITEISA